MRKVYAAGRFPVIWKSWKVTDDRVLCIMKYYNGKFALFSVTAEADGPMYHFIKSSDNLEDLVNY